MEKPRTPKPEPRTPKKAGFSIVEVMVAMVILSITAIGIFASFIATQSYVKRAKRRIVAFNFVRQQLEGLKSAVRQDTWDSGNLAITDADNDDCADVGDWTAWQDLTGEFFTVWGGQRRYCVSGAASGDYREVLTQIRWNAVD